MRATERVTDDLTELGTPKLGPRGGGRGRGKPLPRGLKPEGLKEEGLKTDTPG